MIHDIWDPTAGTREDEAEALRVRAFKERRSEAALIREAVRDF